MKISKDSWHYKWSIDIMSMTPSTNFCTYMRRLFVSIAIIPPIILFFAAVFITAATCFISVPFFLIVEPSTVAGFIGVQKDIIGTMFSIGLIVWAFFVFVMTEILYKKMKRRKKQETTDEPGLVKTFIKSKKEKICPIIEFE